MRKDTAVVRVSRRARILAEKMGTEDNIRHGIEFSLELALAMKLWEIDDVPPGVSGRKGLEIRGEVIRADGPLSSDAHNRLMAHQAHIVDRILERAIARGIESYRREKFLEAKAAEEAAE